MFRVLSPISSRFQHPKTRLTNLIFRSFVRPPVIITLIDNELDEKFIKGGGLYHTLLNHSRPGGQAINKTNSCVQLKHIPTGTTIKTQRFRELQKNRKEARKLMVQALDDLFNGIESKRNLKKEVERLKTVKSKTRSKKKYMERDESKIINDKQVKDKDDVTVKLDNVIQNQKDDITKPKQ